MDLSSLSFVLGTIGATVALGNQVVQFVEKRRRGTVDERRLDVEGLQTLAVQQREELDDMRGQHKDDRERIQHLEELVDQLTAELREVRRELRKAHDDVDRLNLALEMKK